MLLLTYITLSFGVKMKFTKLKVKVVVFGLNFTLSFPAKPTMWIDHFTFDVIVSECPCIA